MSMNTSPNVLERLKLLRFLGIEFFHNQIVLYRGLTQGDNSEFKMLYFRNERIGNLKTIYY